MDTSPAKPAEPEKKLGGAATSPTTAPADKKSMDVDEPSKPSTEPTTNKSEDKDDAEPSKKADEKKDDNEGEAQIKEWFYLDVRPKNHGLPDQEIGPFSLNDINELMSEGVLTLKAQLKKGVDGVLPAEGEWKVISEITEFAEIVRIR